MGLERIGLEGVFELRSFTQGVKQYQSQLGKAVSSTDSAASGLARAGQVMKSAGMVIAASVAAAGAALVGLGGAGLKLALDASASEGIMQGFARSAAQAGMSYEEFLGRLRASSGGVVSDLDLMKQANTALTGAGAELGREFGTKLPRLLEIARASARRTGQDATFLFQSLVLGIKRASPLLIDNTGLQLKVGEANAAMAAQVGKSVEALSAEERQIALLNATLAAGQPLMDELANANITNAELIGQMRTSVTNLKDELGLGLQPALYDVLDPMATLAQRILPELRDAFGLASGAVIEAGGLILQELAALPAQAAGYGQNLGVQFAEGIASAIPYILGVIRAISTIFTVWFAPGSPPKIASDIDVWGRQTIEEFFGAFPTADMSGITQLARGIKSSLLSAVESGTISESAAQGMLGPLRQGIVQAGDDLQRLGKISASTLASIKTAAGPLGGSIGSMTARLLTGGDTSAADAEEEAARAAEQAAEAQRRYEMSIASTQEQIARVQGELAKLTVGTADYYDKLSELTNLQNQLRHEQEAAADAQMNYELSIADTVGQLDIWRKKLSQVTQGSAEYWRIQTTIANLEKQRQRELDSLADAQTGLGSGEDEAAANAKKAAAEAERLADAQFAYKMATTDAAGKVALLQEKLAGLEEGSLEWYQTATQLAHAQEALEKSGGGAGDALDDLANSAAGLAGALDIPKLPDFATKLSEIFDPEKINIDSNAIKAKILAGLRPAFEDSDGSMAAFLGKTFRGIIATALFGPETEGRLKTSIDPMGGIAVVQMTDSLNDASWSDIGKELSKRLGQTIEDAVTDITGWEGLGKWMGDHWQVLLAGSLIARTGVIQSIIGAVVSGLIQRAIISAGVSAAVGAGAGAAGAAAVPAAAAGAGAGAAAVGAGAGAATGTMAALSGSTEAAAVAFGNFTVVAAGALTVIGAIGLAASTAFIGFKLLTDQGERAKFFKSVEDYATGAWQAIDKFAEKLPGPNLGIVALVRSIEGIGKTTKPLDSLKSAWEGTMEAIGKIKLPDLSGIPKWFDKSVAAPVGKFFTEDWTNWWNVTMPTAVTSAEATVNGALSSVSTWVKDSVATPVSKFFTEDWTNWWSVTVPGAVTGAEAKVTAAFGSVWTWMTDNLVAPVTTFFTTDWLTFWNTTLPGGVTGAEAVIVGAFTSVKTWFGENLAAPIDSFFQVEWVTYWDTTLPGAITSAQSTITGAFGKVWTWMDENMVQPVDTFFTDTWPVFWNTTMPTAVTDAEAAVTTAISTAWGWVEATFIAPLDTFFTVTWPNWWNTTIPNTVSGAKAALETAASTAADALLAPFEKAYNDIIAWLTKIGLLNVPTVPPSGGGGGEGGPGGAASGRAYHPGGMVWVGERGPELVDLPRGSSILTAGRSVQATADFIRALPSSVAQSLGQYSNLMPSPSPVMAGVTPGYGAAGGNREVHVAMGPVSINNGLDLATFDARVRSLIRQELR